MTTTVTSIQQATPRRLIGRTSTPVSLPLSAARDRLLARRPPPPGPLGHRSPIRGSVRRRQALYLDAIANRSSVLLACQRSGLSRAIVYRWRQIDPVFRERELHAQEDFADLVRAQLAAAAQESDAVLIFLAKALIPEYMKTVRQADAGVDGLPSRFTLVLGAFPVEAERDPVEALVPRDAR
jgi:hypothetical protein